MAEGDARGTHILVDLTGVHGNPETLAASVLKHSLRLIKGAGVRVVGQQVSIFDGDVSPPGFALVVLLDESHFSAHAYTDEGLFALDLFTCGGTDPTPIMEAIIAHIIEGQNEAKVVLKEVRERFLPSNNLR